ncbi:DUF423 domain-containing protein [Vreelandella rituensis]|uniref:DUF423 domain-containing protein n=1 Tax=Vreelandella rituensis TaxID=2282306 RepID=A0A368U943_9GAMM|nr:DUF423 domain-containing protein [Halomonas rituensis]RCV93475.1 DUF423 domain-containing protein [Halomonas rituensis]
MRDKAWWVGVALSGAVMVIAGAYAAHGMAAHASAVMVGVFETGVRYQAWHTLAMLGVLAWRASMPLAGQRWVLGLWALGMLAFSGSLYAMALGGWNLGLVTPLGGALLIAGWLALAVVALMAERRRSSEPNA